MKWISLSSIDWLMVIPLAVLLVFSLLTLFSIDPSYFKSQLIYLVFCVAVFFVFSRFNISILRYYSLPVYIISIILLALLLVVGAETRGSTRWVGFFGVGVQFSEILKPFLAVGLASYLARLRNNSLKSFFISLILLLPVVVLFLLQPDLGNALIYVFFLGLTLLV
jgi:cell division protein FtsW (lipid II flippase)